MIIAIQNTGTAVRIHQNHTHAVAANPIQLIVIEVADAGRELGLSGPLSRPELSGLSSQSGFSRITREYQLPHDNRCAVTHDIASGARHQTVNTKESGLRPPEDDPILYEPLDETA